MFFSGNNSLVYYFAIYQWFICVADLHIDFSGGLVINYYIFYALLNCYILNQINECESHKDDYTYITVTLVFYDCI